MSYLIGGGFLENFHPDKHLRLLDAFFELEDILTDMTEIRVTDAIIIASDAPID
jgi:hypothetical protein